MARTTKTQTTTFTLRLSPEEKYLLEKLSIEDDRNMSNYILSLIRREAKKQGIEYKPE